MANFRQVCSSQLIPVIAAHLQRSSIEQPEWVSVVKTSHTKEMPPQDAEWFYHRTAAVFRTIAIKNGVGVGGLKKIYGANKNRGVCKSHRFECSGAVIRASIKALEQLGYVEKRVGANDKAIRFVTPNGQRQLDNLAASLLK